MDFELEEDHECEGLDYWNDDDGKSGADECGRSDTAWVEGEGWLCPSHAGSVHGKAFF